MKVFLLLLLATVILSGVTSAKPVAVKEKDKLLDALLALQQEDDDGLVKSSVREQDEEHESEQVLEQEDENRAALIQKLAKINKLKAEAQFWRHVFRVVGHLW